jgi:hypothetical protein
MQILPAKELALSFITKDRTSYFRNLIVPLKLGFSNLEGAF